jgi:hypothetical protein
MRFASRGDFRAAPSGMFAIIRAAGMGGSMKHPLDSLWGTVIAGLVLTVVLYFLARAAMGG